MFFPYRVDYDRRRTPIVTYGLIALNAAVFAFTMSLKPDDFMVFAYRCGFVPEYPTVWTLISSAFVHAGWMHILGNMYYLWLFGRAVEDALSSPTRLSWLRRWQTSRVLEPRAPYPPSWAPSSP